MLENRFVADTIDRNGWAFETPADMDTSYPLLLEWRWYGDGGTSGVSVRWTIKWGYSKDYDLDTSSISSLFTGTAGPTTAPNEKNVVFTQNVPALNKQLVSFISI